MTQISSSLTIVLKTVFILSGIAFLLAGTVLTFVHRRSWSVVCGILGLMLGVVFCVLWWKYIRRATRVFLTDGGICAFIGKQLITIASKDIVAIRKAPLVHRPPLIILFRGPDNSMCEVVFIPSIRHAGFFFAGERMKVFLEEKLGKKYPLNPEPAQNDLKVSFL